MSEAAPRYQFGDIARILEALVAADGTAAHAYANRAGTGVARDALLSLSDLADATYYLCMLHGRHPGVIDHAATRSADNAARQWLIETADAFARERAYLTQVTVATGPAPSTAGQADCETAVSQQRHALDMLAQSDRRGCAMGAAMALVLDWRAVRQVLDMAALRAGLEPHPYAMPDRNATLDVARAIGGDDGIDRAIQFGARQLLNQHRGLWDLLAARADVRARQA
ncbi:MULTISPECIES: DUF6975 family protein [Sphingobium]|uniref:Uncharacterized protein n=2 Tax=Sphingobium cupriresistens TaxID=1132417 RepID=A0A0J7Y470_9SPHN|nr:MULTISPECIES: hypothetical protein [Sphingobium]KMS58467.1 hypothetical protein V473_10240 [Sphingobium cupriresistens LL01]RYM11774.1 hypothetical protein EWH12_08810 [Sphingobium cupriresistens]WCP11925.1 hypothetical protein sphantq_00320 [Sphingobium sp. AntQ-1]